MARRSAVSLVAASLLGLAACGDQAILSPTSPTAGMATAGSTMPAAGRYLVGFDGTAAIAPDVLAAAGGRVIDSIPAMHVLTVDGVTNPDALWAASPRYIDAGFDVTAEPIRDPMAPLGDLASVAPGGEGTPWVSTGVLWDMKTIHAEYGWNQTKMGAGVTACIVDTGVDSTHQELNEGKVLERANFVAGETRTDDPHGHGSHVAGTTAAWGRVISGVAPQANIISARVLNALGSGAETAIILGMNWCVDHGAHVINMSLGGSRYRGNASYINSQNAYRTALVNAANQGVVVVVSAGNSNLRLPNPLSLQVTVPSEVEPAINVGATGPLTRSTAPAPPKWNPFDPSQVWRSVDNKAYYSNYGTGVDVFAPGGRGSVPLSEAYRIIGGVAQGTMYDQIWGVCSSNSPQSGVDNGGDNVPVTGGSCTGNKTRYIAYAGTSQAAPHVTGLAAELYAELGGVRSAANRARVESCIRSTTDVIGPNTTYGGGRINVMSAIDRLKAGTC
jgi:subtilisin family serine protease